MDLGGTIHRLEHDSLNCNIFHMALIEDRPPSLGDVAKRAVASLLESRFIIHDLMIS